MALRPVWFPVRALATGYVDLFRGLPLIICLYLVGFGLPGLRLAGIPNNPVLLGGLALVLVYSAYVAEVLRAWSGLGYNRRALALRESARRLVEDHAGAVPPSVEELLALPGIGPYTARAIAATAFGVPVAPLDVNVRRVVGSRSGGK